MAEWISVKDKLPEETDLYLVFFGDSEIYRENPEQHNPVDVQMFRPDMNGFYDSIYNRYVRNITHWMPLPEKPEGYV